MMIDYLYGYVARCTQKPCHRSPHSSDFTAYFPSIIEDFLNLFLDLKWDDAQSNLGVRSGLT